MTSKNSNSDKAKIAKFEAFPLDLRNYVLWTDVTAIYDQAGEQNEKALAYTALGLNGEAGEVAEIIKKMMRAQQDPATTYTKLKDELGDVLYYWARLCREAKVDPIDVMYDNFNKLMTRREQDNLTKTD